MALIGCNISQEMGRNKLYGFLYLESAQYYCKQVNDTIMLVECACRLTSHS